MNQERNTAMNTALLVTTSSLVVAGCGVPDAWKDVVLISDHGPYQIESCQIGGGTNSADCKKDAATKCADLGLQQTGDVVVRKNPKGRTETHITCFEATY